MHNNINNKKEKEDNNVAYNIIIIIVKFDKKYLCYVSIVLIAAQQKTLRVAQFSLQNFPLTQSPKSTLNLKEIFLFVPKLFVDVTLRSHAPLWKLTLQPCPFFSSAKGDKFACLPP